MLIVQYPDETINNDAGQSEYNVAKFSVVRVVDVDAIIFVDSTVTHGILHRAVFRQIVVEPQSHYCACDDAVAISRAKQSHDIPSGPPNVVQRKSYGKQTINRYRE